MLTLRTNFLIKIAIITVKKIISNKIEIILILLINLWILYSLFKFPNKNNFGTILMGYILVFAICSSGIIKQELQKNTLVPFIVSPLSKEEILLGKFLGPSISILLIMLLNYGIFSAVQLLHGKPISPLLNLKVILYLYLIGLYFFSLGILFSTFLKGNKNFIMLTVLSLVSFITVIKMGLEFSIKMEKFALNIKEKIFLFFLSLGNPIFFKFVDEKNYPFIILSLIALYLIISLYFIRKISLENSR
ncbi:MAG: ABC transporter permease subunit [Acidobacteriota bacterium]